MSSACQSERSSSADAPSETRGTPAEFWSAAAADDDVPVQSEPLPDLPETTVVTASGPCLTGAASGTVCAPSGALIPGAQIIAETTDCFGQTKEVEAYSDFRGFFRMDGLAPGTTAFRVSTGVFNARFVVEVVAGEETPISGDENAKICLDSDAANIAVLGGEYDDIGSIIGELGFDYTSYCGTWASHRPAFQLLANFEALSAYDILFVNCGSGIDLRVTNEVMDTVRGNLMRFVREGGSIYVSDLSADFVSQLWPAAVTFDFYTEPQPIELEDCCLCVDCMAECVADPPGSPGRRCEEPNLLPDECRTARSPSGRGMSGTINAAIDSSFLQTFIGADTMELRFNASNWIGIDRVDASVEVLVSNQQGQPMMILFQPYAAGGRVAYTSFHNHVQATESMRNILRALIFRL